MSVEHHQIKRLKLFAPRDPEEQYRVATPLELLFDLIFVVAIALCLPTLWCFLHYGGHG